MELVDPNPAPAPMELVQKLTVTDASALRDRLAVVQFGQQLVSNIYTAMNAVDVQRIMPDGMPLEIEIVIRARPDLVDLLPKPSRLVLA